MQPDSIRVPKALDRVRSKWEPASPATFSTLKNIRWVVVFVGTLTLVGFFLLGGTLTGHDRLAFRDVSHFYTPLYQYVAERCHGDWLPLWNPLDHTGIPLVGETTTAVFYPIRYLLFALPIPTSVAMAWYVLVHFMIASVNAFVAARAMSVRRDASIVAAIVYPLSGSVWFLYTNPPYLAASAWLPLVIAMLIGDCDSRRRSMVAAVALSMMILGGDPQTALHAMMVTTAVLVWRTTRKRESPARLSKLLLVPLIAAALTAPQLAASLSWSGQSTRVRADAEESLLDPPTIGGKRHQAFQYSLPPWHSLELLTPNASGSLLPVHRRITRLIPGDGQMWTPTIYVGLLAAIAIIDRLMRIRREGIDATFALAIASLGLASGHFGITWWVQATTGMLGGVDSAVGGPYWWLYHFIPGYDSLRYPAKWLPFFSFASSMLVARWLDEQRWKNSGLPLAILTTLMISGFATLTFLKLVWFPNRGPAETISDPFWGPLDVVGGLNEVGGSLIHSSIVLAVIWVLVRSAREKNWRSTTVITAFCAITLVDLVAVARSNTHTVDVATEQRLVAATSDDRPVDVGRWMRTRSGPGWPRHWRETSSTDRLMEVEASQQLSWFGRWHLASLSPVLNNMVSIESQAMANFWVSTKSETQTMDETHQREYWKRQRTELEIDGVVHSSEEVAVLAVGDTNWHLVDSHFIRPATSHNDLEKPLRVTRPIYQDGHWTARYRATGSSLDESPWEAAMVMPYRGLMQAVSIPPGKWEVKFRYRPWWLWPTIAISLAAWAIVSLQWMFIASQQFSTRPIVPTPGVDAWFPTRPRR